LTDELFSLIEVTMADDQKRFDPVSSRVSFPELEERMLELWRKQDTFHQVDKVRANAPMFIFYEGPPTANGSPGIHHVLSRSFKDVIIRYKTMQGFRPLRRGGWDTHGLPVELEVEKELGLATKADIEQFGIEEFNRRCRESVFRYVKEWEAMTERAGVWLDMDAAYVTYHNSYIEGAWWVFKQLWDKGFIYEAYRVTPHCPRCVTSLSSHEVALGYQDDTQDPSIFVRFPLKEQQTTAYGVAEATLAKLGYAKGAWTARRPSLMAWTTTPWTLTANMALAVGPDVEYALVESGETGERVVLAASLSERVLGAGWTVIERLGGSDLAGLLYDPPYAGEELADHTHRVLPAGYVTTGDGTGIVHTAPAYGAEDAELGKEHDFPTVHTVDLRGILQGDFPGAGKFVKQADKDIIADLDHRGLLFRSETIRHTYPFCWRCGTPLLYYAKASWDIRTAAVKDRMGAGNQGINWVPDHIKEGRFGEWLRNNVDWAVSRERYWGTPIPIWRCESCDAATCVGGVGELAALATPETKPLVADLDLHRPYVDRVELVCDDCGGVMKRVPEVADAWYDSGAMPFAQWAYPLTTAGPEGETLHIADANELIESPLFPADYITEAIDQTRGWFYSLLALSTLIADKPPYKNVIVLGLILDGKGEKMSKSKGNVVDPGSVMREQGADALRWYLFTAAPAGAARRFSSELVAETLRRFMLTLWNTYSFFVTYANIDDFDPQANAAYWAGEIGGPSFAKAPPNELDRWVVSELNDLVRDVSAHLEGYSPTDAGRRIEDFVDLLSNWYVRRSRRRFWRPVLSAVEGSENDDDKTWAHVTLYSCLLTLSRLMAPLTPFLADAIYRNLAPAGSPDSVHLADYPKADERLIDDDLDHAVRLAMRIASLGRAARSKNKIKVRQPLARVLVRASPEEAALVPVIEAQILDELNVKAVEVAADDTLASFRLRPNLPLLGPKYGKQIGAIRAALEAADASVVAAQLRSGEPALVGGFSLEPDEVLVDLEEREGFAVSMEGSGGLIVGMDTELTPELEAEGLARELVHRIQNVRKAAGLDIEDRITLYVDGSGGGELGLGESLSPHVAYVMSETLALQVVAGPPPAGVYAEQQDIEGVPILLGVAKTH
jgi:isoleucyl-tRNA synthetase